jgi:signal transduction histidine kinase
MRLLLSFVLWPLLAISAVAGNAAAPEARSMLVGGERYERTLNSHLASKYQDKRIGAIVVAAGTFLGHGPIGGYVLTPSPVGQEAAKIANELQLREENEARFHGFGVWTQYKFQVLAVLGALIVQAGLITWLVHEHHQRSLAETRSRNAMGELANMNRLAAAGELSATIAHEINQPIYGMVLKANAALRWLTGETPDVEKARGALSDIVGTAHRAADIVNSVRAMLKKEANAKVPVNVNSVINGVLALVQTDLQSRGVRVETRLDESFPAATGDPVQLQQVILNLVMNAAEAMRTVQPRVLKIRTSRSVTGMVHAAIEDSGVGVGEADRDRIFDPLFTTKPDGMGMGLSICRSIIQNHGGRIWVVPAAGRGAIFQFELPAASAQSSYEQAA